MTSLLEWWASIYANDAALRTGIEFMHIAGLLGGGGCAIAADLLTLAMAADAPATHGMTVQLLDRTHGIVLLGLTALLVSGLLLVAADAETFLYSRVFWLKLGLIALLLANGAGLRRRTRQAASGVAPPWPLLQRHALASLVLWFLTTLAGVGLLNMG